MKIDFALMFRKRLLLVVEQAGGPVDSMGGFTLFQSDFQPIPGLMAKISQLLVSWRNKPNGNVAQIWNSERGKQPLNSLMNFSGIELRTGAVR